MSQMDLFTDDLFMKSPDTVNMHRLLNPAPVESSPTRLFQRNFTVAQWSAWKSITLEYRMPTSRFADCVYVGGNRYASMKPYGAKLRILRGLEKKNLISIYTIAANRIEYTITEYGISQMPEVSAIQ